MGNDDWALWYEIAFVIFIRLIAFKVTDRNSFSRRQAAKLIEFPESYPMPFVV